MWWMALAKAIQGTQDAMRQQDARRKQAAYNTEANLPIASKSVQFGMDPTKGKPVTLQAPGSLEDEADVDEFIR